MPLKQPETISAHYWNIFNRVLEAIKLDNVVIVRPKNTSEHYKAMSSKGNQAIHNKYGKNAYITIGRKAAEARWGKKRKVI